MTAWGALPVAMLAVAFVAARVGALAFQTERVSSRAVAGVTLALALVVLVTRGLGALGLLSGVAFGVVLAVGTIAVATLARRTRLALPWREIVSRETAPLLVVLGVAVVIAIVAARWLPIWQWDALGYHLPFVDFALEGHGLAAVPKDVPYISTYPHDVELCMLAMRALLPDDRLVDLAQIPFALAGAIATAGIARVAGAARPQAVAAGAAWVLVPAVFLQMPTDYVDVASAAFFLMGAFFVLAEPTTRTLLLAGVAIGLYLGSKPNAPIGAAILSAVLVARGVRSKRALATAGALTLVLGFGAEAYVVNLVRHGNPVWPIRVAIGPLRLPGTTPMQQLLDAGAMAPRLHGPVLSRVVRSWISLTSAPVFDMRIGGYGPIFLAALPLAVIDLVRRRAIAASVIVAASLASPDPAVARYVLAFPALVLAFAAVRASAASAHARPWIGACVATAAAWQLSYAVPGLTGDGPPLLRYAAMTDAQRREAVGAAGPPTDAIAARGRVGPGETFALDKSFELAHLAWTPDLAYRVVWVHDDLSSADVGALVEREHVRVIAAGDEEPAGEWIRNHPERFERLFTCRAMPCAVYLRR